jgi:hypothetical protein
MLQHTIDRIEKLISKERILVVADPDHREEVRTRLCDRPPDKVITTPNFSEVKTKIKELLSFQGLEAK